MSGARPENLRPVLLGGDMNCYSVARAFHEAYGVVSRAFGRWPMGETRHSRIVRFTAVPDMDEDAAALRTLAEYAERTPGAKRVLMGCTDDYAALIIRNREALSERYTVPYIGAQLMEKLVTKDSFYRYCDEYGIPYPATLVLRGPRDAHLLDAPPFADPIILKPAGSIEYWKHPFEGMKKVYTAQSAAQAREITAAIFASGYRQAVIAQDMIPGADDGMRVLTAYSDSGGRVKMACLGHVLLEEHTPRALGNHAAVITEYDGPLMEGIAAFLNAIGYTGFSNFDIKYDPRDGRYKVFEINLRQGRSNYYVTGAGLNIARLVAEDRVLGLDSGEPVFFKGEAYWHSIPNGIVRRYTADRPLAERAMRLAAEGRGTTALGYAYDLRLNPLRRLYLFEHNRRYRKKYAKYCPKSER